MVIGLDSSYMPAIAVGIAGLIILLRWVVWLVMEAEPHDGMYPLP
jgi:hypothetical protein